MTPKEKALSLLDKMKKQTYSYQEYVGANSSIDEIGYEAGKKCALITVENLINEYPSFPRGTWEESRALYWLEVKQELEKL
jgi:hypothetical protein